MPTPSRSRKPRPGPFAIGSGPLLALALATSPAAALEEAPAPEVAAPDLAGADTALALVGPRVLGPAEFRRQWARSAAEVLSPDEPAETWKATFLEALVERDLLTVAALEAGFQPTREQEAYLGAVRLIEMRVAYYRRAVWSGPDGGSSETSASDETSASNETAGSDETSAEQARYEALVERLLSPTAPAYVDSNLALLVAAFAGVPPPVAKGPEGPYLDFRLHLPNLAPGDTGRTLATTTAGVFTVGRFVWHWGQLHALDRVPPASVEQARLWTERFLAQAPMDAEARALGYDHLPEVERAVERQRDAFAGEWYFRTVILARADTSEAAIRARWERDPARYHGASHHSYRRLWYATRAEADSALALCHGGASWDELLASRFAPETPAAELEEFQVPRALAEDSPDTLLARWFTGAAPGEVVGPRELDGRFWVYQFLAHREGRASTYAEARPFVRDETLFEESEHLLREELTELARRHPVRRFPERLAAVAVEDPFQGSAPAARPATGPLMPPLWEQP